ncbi:glyoxalase-like protein [Eilatimonas milleporae]|uniref:Glyoxalase-like protein n=2 Tax=Eilatimonas milleporae TaxID=911205 RepID=A0A3M0BYY0_9PROT|nr:glyoxalase-like protein [Eilatimonas milleporae]
MIFMAVTGAAAADCPDRAVSLDHIVWTVPDLETAAADFAARAGVRPAYGGEHTNGTTANFLVALGPCSYLEIVGPKKGVSLDMLGDQAPTYARGTVAGFAFGMRDSDEAAETLKMLGLSVGAPRDGGREKPDGTRLKWRTVNLSGLDFGEGTFAFAIRWLSEPHPAETSPQGVRLRHLILSGKTAAKLDPLVEGASLPILIEKDAAPDIRVVLETPNGPMTIE